MMHGEAIANGDDTLRIACCGENVTITVGLREGKLLPGPDTQSHTITIPEDEFVALLGRLGYNVQLLPW
jgi:hypothetical protein